LFSVHTAFLSLISFIFHRCFIHIYWISILCLQYSVLHFIALCIHISVSHISLAFSFIFHFQCYILLSVSTFPSVFCLYFVYIFLLSFLCYISYCQTLCQPASTNPSSTPSSIQIPVLVQPKLFWPYNQPLHYSNHYPKFITPTYNIITFPNIPDQSFHHPPFSLKPYTSNLSPPLQISAGPHHLRPNLLPSLPKLNPVYPHCLNSLTTPMHACPSTDLLLYQLVPAHCLHL